MSNWLYSYHTGSLMLKLCISQSFFFFRLSFKCVWEMQYKLCFICQMRNRLINFCTQRGVYRRRPTAHPKYCAGLPQQRSNCISQRDSLQFQLLNSQHGPDVTLEWPTRCLILISILSIWLKQCYCISKNARGTNLRKLFWDMYMVILAALGKISLLHSKWCFAENLQMLNLFQF